ncbi:MAG: prepilin peptidase [Verrucomicrobiota bacterium]
MFDKEAWALVPFDFWALTFFVYGCIFGSLLNVIIYRVPLGQSIVSPRSHCPKCQKLIPWYYNIPIISWLQLKGRCAFCGTPISIRYFLVEFLTGVVYMTSWVSFGDQSAMLAIIYCVLFSGFIVATFIDFEHFIIPDEITFGGMVVGFLAAAAFPVLHGAASRPDSIKESAIGMAVGGGLVYAILRGGKLLFGRKTLEMEHDSKLIFTETDLHLPGQVVPFEDIFYRKSDTIVFHAKKLELVDRCYKDVLVRLRPDTLEVDDEKMNPEDVPHMEAVTDKVVLPQEAMGLGDVKFMAAIGAFIGWPGVVFSLMVSSIIGSIVGVSLVLMRKQEWSSRLPYGPYIAIAATIWVFKQAEIMAWWRGATEPPM